MLVRVCLDNGLWFIESTIARICKQAGAKSIIEAKQDAEYFLDLYYAAKRRLEKEQ